MWILTQQGNPKKETNAGEQEPKPEPEKETAADLDRTVFVVCWPLLLVAAGIAADVRRGIRKKREAQAEAAETKQPVRNLTEPKKVQPEPIPYKPRTISKAERDHMIRADAYREMCGGRSIWEMAGVPEGVYFDQENLPHTLGTVPEEDPFFVYVTPKGESYHLHTCRLAGNASPVNICWAKHAGKKPCKICKPAAELPRFVSRYQELKRIQKEYGVDMLP